MKIELPYGSEVLTLTQPQKGLLDVVQPKSMTRKDAPPLDFLNNHLPQALAQAESVMVLFEISDIMFPIDLFMENLSKIVQTSGVSKQSLQIILTFRFGLESFASSMSRLVRFDSHIHNPERDD